MYTNSYKVLCSLDSTMANRLTMSTKMWHNACSHRPSSSPKFPQSIFECAPDSSVIVRNGFAILMKGRYCRRLTLCNHFYGVLLQKFCHLRKRGDFGTTCHHITVSCSVEYLPLLQKQYPSPLLHVCKISFALSPPKWCTKWLICCWYEHCDNCAGTRLCIVALLSSTNVCLLEEWQLCTLFRKRGFLKMTDILLHKY